MVETLGLRGFVDLEDVVDILGLKVYELPMEPELQEFKRGRQIVVRKALPKEWKRFVIAHAIGHHLLYGGNQVFMRKATAYADPMEHQADTFAFRLLVNYKDIIRHNLHEAWEVAEYFGVPEERVRVQKALIFS